MGTRKYSQGELPKGVEVEQIARHVTSASNLARRAACPGSERLEAGLPDEETEEAKIGTLLHQYDANPKLDRSFLSQRNRELLRIAEICDEKVFARVREQFSIPDDEPPMRQSTAGEEWVVGDTPGHTDRWAYFNQASPSTGLCRGLLLVIDKKFGFKEVTPAESNYQLRCYACGGAEMFPKTENVVVAITQPRLPYEQRITMACYSKDDIAAAREEIFAIRSACREPDAPLVPGPEQCRYCKAKLICPAFQAEMQNAYALVPVEKTGTLTKRKADAQEILARCSDEDLDRMIQFVRMAKFVEEMAINEGRARVEAGKLSMYELGRPSQPRFIADPAKAEALLALKGLLDRQTIWACSSMALGKLEEAVAEKGKLTMKEARKLIDETLASVIGREERKPSLIRKS